MSKPNPRIPRLFVDAALAGGRIDLPAESAHYLGTVRRLRAGDAVIAFNGRGEERRAVVETLSRRHTTLVLSERVEPLAEPALALTLVQGLVKSDAMDLIVQKAVELGAAAVYAVETGFGVVRLRGERSDRRLEHWTRIARGACEQSGRHRPPEIRAFAALDDCVAALPADGTRLALDPASATPLRAIDAPPRRVAIAVGPEGGFTAAELERFDAAGFARTGLGPRVLRAETAAIAACALAQALWGDGGR